MYKAAILPCGKLNTTTGMLAKFGQRVDEFWKFNGTLEVWRKTNGNLVVISTAGASCHKEGDRESFQHDQTQRALFDAVFVSDTRTREFGKLVPFGNSLSVYCYK